MQLSMKKNVIMSIFRNSWGEVDWILPVLYELKQLKPDWLLYVCFSPSWKKTHKVCINNQAFENEIVKICQKKHLNSVLEIGCFDGYILYHLKKKGYSVVGTGQANTEEIDAAISIFSNNPLSLLHCISSYPTPDEEVNLYSIPFLIDQYKLPVGYSDHTIGILACIGAVVAGAVIIEKHFTLDNSQNFGDHILSATPKDMKLMVSEIRRIEKMLGKKNKKCQQSELISKKQLRRSLHINTDIKDGSILKSNMIIPLISNAGIPSNKIDEILGKKIIKNLKKFDPIKENFLSD